MSDCFFCSLALQCTDGRLRCSKNFSLAEEFCNDFDLGHAKFYNPKPAPIKKRVKLKVVKVKPIKSKKTKHI